MSATYYGILTRIGEAKQANAMALGEQLKISQLSVGDGGGDGPDTPTPTPDPEQEALIREWRKAPINQLYVDPNNANYLVAEQVLPEGVGGHWIREWGLWDEDGDLIAVSNCPPTYKPLLAEGSGRTQVIRMVIMVASTAAFTLKIDPSVVLATRKYVDEGLLTRLGKNDTAAAATKLAAERTITLTGDVTGTIKFDGSKNVSAATTHKNSGVQAGTYGDMNLGASLTIDAKGRVTKAANVPMLAMDWRLGTFGTGNFVVLDTPGTGTWQRPAGATLFRVRVVGAGGSNTTVTGSGAGGAGGGGGFAGDVLDLTGVESVPYVVGAGGVPTSAGSSGGTSSFGDYLSATGGGAPNGLCGGAGGAGFGRFRAPGGTGGGRLGGSGSRGGGGGGAGSPLGPGGDGGLCSDGITNPGGAGGCGGGGQQVAGTGASTDPDECLGMDGGASPTTVNAGGGGGLMSPGQAGNVNANRGGGGGGLYGGQANGTGGGGGIVIEW